MVWRFFSQDDRSQFTDPGTEERLRAGNPLHIALQPADLAGAYVFLSSRTSARGITGTILTVDAGAMLRVPRRNPAKPMKAIADGNRI